ncbi:diguanylate cyclase [Acinetobacter sp. 194]|nr:GGDEF domain-containing protein [Acinetobacter shaoyimingii]NHB57880.1 diguanylate cyclase [Acinetobacter shaoyimingii]
MNDLENEVHILRQEKLKFEQLLLQQKKSVNASFDDALEHQFWKDRQDRIIKLIGRAVFPAIVIYFIFHCVSLSMNYLSADPLYRERDIFRNHFSFAGSWLALLIIFTLAKHPQWHYLYGKIVPYIVFFGIGLNSAILLSMYSLPLAWRGSIVVALAIVFVYVCSGLKPKITFLASILSALLSIVYFHWADVQIASWVVLNALLLPNLVGFALALLVSSTEKIRFLQSIIIHYDRRIYALMNQHFKDLSHQDALTLLGNRRGFNEYLSQTIIDAKQTQSSFALLFIDIDFFKLYNDYYGHEQGDQALIQVAHCMSCSLPDKANAVRFGGEEFVIVLHHIHQAEAEVFAQQLLQKIRSLDIEHQRSSVAKHLTVSIGLTVYDGQDNVIYADVLKAADQALYQAKALGRNRVFVQYLNQ